MEFFVYVPLYIAGLILGIIIFCGVCRVTNIFFYNLEHRLETKHKQEMKFYED